MDQIQFERQKRFSAQISFCRICGDKARYMNYGTLACPSCKTFFRRHAFHTENVYICQFNGNCEITTKCRRSCTACRLAKCLAMGMNSYFIRKEYFNKNQCLTITCKQKSPSQLPTLDLLCTDRSSLTSFDWRLLSNVIHAFDKFSPVLETHQVIDRLSIWSPHNLSFDISQLFRLHNLFYTSTESFISSIADFQVLTLTEKSSLFQRNLHGILNLCFASVSTNSGMLNSSTNQAILTSVYGPDIYRQIKHISMNLEHDSTIIKLILVILAFSSNCYMVDVHENMHKDSLLHGTFRLFGSQNIYIEILWKYMTHRYSYYEASIRLTILVKHVLDLLKISGNAHRSNEIHQNIVDEVMVLAKNVLTLNENEVVPLWGKT